MPMKWDAAAESKLFCAVLKVHNVKLNYKALATEMGPDCTAKAIIHRIAGIRKLGNPTASTTVEESDSSDGKSPAPKLAKAPGKKLVVSSVKKNDGLKVKKSPAPTTTKKRGADQMDDPTITFDYDAAAATIEETRKRLGMRKKIKVEEGTIAEVEDRDEDAEKESVGAGEE